MFSSRQCLLLILLASACGAGGVALATWTFGPGTSPDSATYLQGASNILRGNGYVQTLPDGSLRAITHWPPFYSMLLAVVASLAGTPVAAAHLAAISFFAINIALAALMLKSYCRTTTLVVIAAFFMACSFDLVRLHSIALSEATFFSLMLISLCLAARHLDSQKLAPLVAAAVAASLAMVTRYAGAAIICAIFMVVLFRSPAARWRRLANSMVFGVIACIPFVALLIRNRIAGASAANRIFNVHLIDFSYAYSAATTVSEWLAPSTSPLTLRVSVLLLLVVAAVWVSVFLWRNRHDALTTRPLALLPHLLIAFSFSYVLVYVLTISFFDSYIVEKLSYRAMSPLLLAGILLLPIAIQRLIDLHRFGLLMRRSALTILICLTVVQFVQSSMWVADSYRNGIGLTARKWRDGDLIAAVRNIPVDTPIITNAADIVYLNTGRLCYRIPARTEPVSLLPNKDYTLRMNRLRAILANQHAVLVYFHGYGEFAFMPSHDETRTALGPLRGHQYDQGTLYLPLF